MGLANIAVRVLVVYIYLLVMTRVTGKRMIRQATPFDFIVSLVVGDLIDDALWAEVSMARFAAAAGSIILLDLILKLVACRSERLFILLNGRPSIVLRDGEADKDALRAEQLTEDDLAEFLRLGGIEDRKEVRLAILDQDHQLSILRQWWSRPVRKEDREAVT